MIEIRGTYNTAVCWCETLEHSAEEQIRLVCDTEAFSDSKIRIMPDVHAGMGCTIGTTMTLIDKVVPGMVGVDIGCGMEVVKLAEKRINFSAFDQWIRHNIPSGRDIRDTNHPYGEEAELEKLHCIKEVNPVRAYRSIGTLGGGNHFIEVDTDGEGNLYLVVHSGSRHIGNEVALWYQQEGYRQLCGNSKRQLDEVVAQLKAEGREKEIQSTVKKLKKSTVMSVKVPKNLAYVAGELFSEYMDDMRRIQHFADLNRKAMVRDILKGMKLTAVDSFATIHNYIDTDAMILRKGAVSAKEGEKLLIPINMRDGSFICRGKGNPDWNCSAPHGAGRRLSRADAKNSLSMEDYREQMEGIFTTCVSRDTIDESPMAYKDMAEIVSQITPTAEILEHITPVYNFKAAE